jgi:hypothetical protein
VLVQDLLKLATGHLAADEPLTKFDNPVLRQGSGRRLQAEGSRVGKQRFIL